MISLDLGTYSKRAGKKAVGVVNTCCAVDVQGVSSGPCDERININIHSAHEKALAHKLLLRILRALLPIIILFFHAVAVGTARANTIPLFAPVPGYAGECDRQVASAHVSISIYSAGEQIRHRPHKPVGVVRLHGPLPSSFAEATEDYMSAARSVKGASFQSPCALDGLATTTAGARCSGTRIPGRATDPTTYVETARSGMCFVDVGGGFTPDGLAGEIIPDAQPRIYGPAALVPPAPAELRSPQRRPRRVRSAYFTGGD